AMRPVLKRGENEISDYEAVLGVAKALGMKDELKGWETPRDCFNLMRECTRNMPCDFTGITWEMLENSHGIQWPYPEGTKETREQRRLYEDGNFFTPTKKAQFIFEEVRENPLPLTEEYPFLFNTGRGSVGQWHTQSRTKEVKFVEDVSAKKAYLYMNTKTGKKYDIKEMDEIRVYSVNGQNAVFHVKLTDNVTEGELYAPIHYVECNKLTPSVYDSYSKEPSYKATPVRFEKCQEEKHVSDKN
ncbi:MAG: molybdopterin dinucleotide binding domain-containing protein, partial [Lachnospiraceae bacterium]|nr:molybdopterin dinucleotide binding domain-containing protein [Lachnospiraceae bacterium]